MPDADHTPPGPAPTDRTPPVEDDPFASDDGAGLRARKKKMTRRAIHAAALTLVAERGLDHVTAEEIAAAADVSPRTFFNYFPTKDAAVLGAPPDLPGILGDALLRRPSEEDLFTAVTGVVRIWCRKIDQDPLRDQRRLVVGRDPRLGAAMVGTNREVEAALADAAARRPGAHDDLTARVVVAAVLATTRACYAHTQGCVSPDAPDTHAHTFAAALDDAFALLAHGLA